MGRGEIYYHLTYIDDLVEGFRLCGEHPAAANRTYILAGREVTTLNEVTASIADVAGVRPQRWHLPVWPFWLAGAACEARLRAASASSRRSYRRRVDFFTKSRAFDITRAERRSATRPRSGCERASPAPCTGTANMAGSDAPAGPARAGHAAARQIRPEPDHPSRWTGHRISSSRPGKSSRAKYAELVIGQPGVVALLKHELIVTLAQARPGALGLLLRKAAVSAAARIVRAQRGVRSERRAAPPAQDSHRQQRRDRRQLPHRRQGRVESRHSNRQTACSSAATASCRARTATSTSPTR